MNTATAWSDDHFIAGDVALDFANTVYRRTPEIGIDLLDSANALTAWLHHAKLLPALDDARDRFDGSQTALCEARRMRELFWGIFEAKTDGRDLPADALADLLDTARRGIGSDVAVGPDGSTAPLTAQGALTVLALHGVRLALSPSSQPVRSCDRCGWFFTDTSRGRRRRWCSMKTCGNQAKAARYRSAHP
ncbi:CGNR zinc finger domain-containing protein [Allosalinactinospora lopnorensis]|uniref:CGNR zinc finger domain-containing protein n=1 Tax=Allosalinactinospora lopnorensis TaxID=1352348 RepID=UPI000623D71F|nr:ABATE domain-containing protein [Allosalinactinospora lopnorensis]